MNVRKHRSVSCRKKADPAVDRDNTTEPKITSPKNNATRDPDVKMKKNRGMIDESSVQRAHDLLTSLMFDDPAGLWKRMSPRQQGVLIDCANVLCWVLKHDHNPKFAELLDDIENALIRSQVYLVEMEDEEDPDRSD